ncbi:MAG: hypothetical protein QXX12_00675 [Nanopusillaceae archaeon]
MERTVRMPIVFRPSLIELVVLTILSNRLSGIIKEEDAERILAHELLNEIKSLSIIDPDVWNKFRQYVLMVFDKYFSHKIVKPKTIGETFDIEKELFDYLYQHAPLIVENYQYKEENMIREEVMKYVYKIIMISARAYFRERGDFR